MNLPRQKVDVNVYTSHWPFRRVPGDEPAELIEKLRSFNVTQAWTSSFDGLFHRDIAAVNLRLSRLCETHGDGILIPFGMVNPNLPNWEDDVRRCHEEHKMPGIRLHPNYHGYKLDQSSFVKLLEMASERRLIVQVVISMEDERTQSFQLSVPHVDATPLAAIVRRMPHLKLMILNAFRGMTMAKVIDLIGSGQVYTDIAMLEGVGAVRTLSEKIPVDRIVFGSFFPLFYFESSVLKLREAALGDQQLRSIEWDNGNRLLTALQ